MSAPDPCTAELIEKHLAGEASPAEAAELRQALAARPELAADLFRAARLHRCLQTHLAEAARPCAVPGASAARAAAPAPAAGRRLIRLPWLWQAAAGVALVLGLLGVFHLLAPARGPLELANQTSAPQIRALADGTVLALAPGAQLVAEGAVELPRRPEPRSAAGQVQIRQLIRLQAGQVEVRAPKTGAGEVACRVETPDGLWVETLGTTFTVTRAWRNEQGETSMDRKTLTGALMAVLLVTVSEGEVLTGQAMAAETMVAAGGQAEVGGGKAAASAKDGAAVATVAWGEAVNEVQAGLVPLGGVKDWKGFLCPNHTNGITNRSMPEVTAASKRCCRVCEAPKPWSATFIEGEPMRMELHVRNLAKEARSLYGAGYPEHWRFTFTPCIRGTSWQSSYVIEARRKAESIEECTIRIAAGQQNAVELDLERDWRWRFSSVSSGMFSDPQRRQPATNRLPPGKYTVTASYAHPEHEQTKTCTYWHGTVTTGTVEIEIKADDATAGFLDAAKYAGFAAVAEVKALPQPGDGEKPAQLGIAWKDLLYAPDAARQAMTKVTALALPYLKPGVADDKATAGLKVGDKILVVVDERTVRFRVRSANGRALLPVWLEGAQWLSWSQSRQDALASVLAPGWQKGACPWCLNKNPLANFRVGLAIQRGTCVNECGRTIGPATRDVTFRLWAYDPRVPQAKQLSNICRIQPGEMFLPLWVEVQNEKAETPEFQTPNGGAQFELCDALFYLVEGPGLSGPTAAFRCELARAMAPSALRQGSAVGPVELIGGTLFAKPGAYTVRAVAGRLVSNPVTVIVGPEIEGQREARRQAKRQAEVKREQQIQREREQKQRATGQPAPAGETPAPAGDETF